MARKRMIDPEFWTDEKIVQLPYEGRLLFIGLWNFADDEGLLWDEPDRIRLQVLPNDQVDVDGLLDLLVASGLLERYYADDSRSILRISHFLAHQKISHPAESKIPLESSRKIVIPQQTRRAVAKKYGCAPGEQAQVECYYCGLPGSIRWWSRNDGKPSAWVSFSGLELDHFVSESNGGATNSENIVLACRECNRSKGTKDGIAFLEHSGYVASPPEDSGSFTPKLKEEKLSKEKRREDTESAPKVAPSLDEPFDLFVLLCEENDVSPDSIAPSGKTKQLGIARRLLDEGFSLEKTRRCLRYLKAQDWRTGTIDLGTVLSEGPKWELNGMPEKPKPRASPSKQRNGFAVDEWDTTVTNIERRQYGT